MTEILETLRQVVHAVTMTLGYPGILLLMMAENLFPPIPSEIVMPFAGFLVSSGDLHLAGIMAAGTAGSLLGGWIIYWLGAGLGLRRLESITQRYGKYLLLSVCDLDRAVQFFHRRGRYAVLLGRLVPGVRSLISLPAGINRMPLGEFFLFTTIGTLIWNIFLAGAGMTLGKNWDRILALIDTYEKILLSGMAAVLLVFAVRRLLRYSKAGAGFEDEC